MGIGVYTCGLERIKSLEPILIVLLQQETHPSNKSKNKEQNLKSKTGKAKMQHTVGSMSSSSAADAF